jgi:uncharacterized SAM-binding protein YcdF (DUF218 family)
MPMVEPENDQPGAAGLRASPRRSPAARGSRLRRIGGTAIAVGAVLLVSLAGGFGWFLLRLPADEIMLDRNADGIVVLTGGAFRIFDAMELLAAGRGKRLLISGTDNPATTSGEISRVNPRYGRIINCCVDFDRSQNTVENAIETRHWAQTRGFRSLIVVTSSYHMPRAIAEIAHQLPDTALLPFPVFAERSRAEPWWWRGATVKLIFSEYLKYLAAQLRFRLAPPATAIAAAPESEAGQSFSSPRQIEHKHTFRLY